MLLSKVVLAFERDGLLSVKDVGGISGKHLYYRISTCISVIAMIMPLFYLSEYVTLNGTYVVNYRDTAELGSHNVSGEEYALYDKISDTVSDLDNTPNTFDANHCNVSDFDNNNGTISLSVDSAQKGASVTLPEFNYIHYVAEDDSGQKIEIENGENNRIKLAIPESYSGHITVRYQSPWFWRFYEIISLFTFVGLILIVVRIK